MRQTSLCCDALLRQLAPAQRRQQVTRQLYTRAVALGQPLFGQEVGALLQVLLRLAAETSISEPFATTDQLLEMASK